MTTALATAAANGVSPAVMELTLLQGDLSRLNSGQRVEYMTAVCNSLGLNPLTKPFEFISLNGKLVMYAKRDCTEQLRKIHGVSITIVAREVVEGCYIVTARAQDARGRVDESVGAVPIENLKGENRANALMKAETKAKRRVTLSICGLGMLDETEVASVPGARVVEAVPTPPPATDANAAADRERFKAAVEADAPKAGGTASPAVVGRIPLPGEVSAPAAPPSAAVFQSPADDGADEVGSGERGAAAQPAPLDQSSPPANDDGTPCSEEAVTAIMGELKRLQWTWGYVKVWVRERFDLDLSSYGAKEAKRALGALSMHQADATFFLLMSAKPGKDLGDRYRKMLAEFIADRKVRA